MQDEITNIPLQLEAKGQSWIRACERHKVEGGLRELDMTKSVRSRAFMQGQ